MQTFLPKSSPFRVFSPKMNGLFIPVRAPALGHLYLSTLPFSLWFLGHTRWVHRDCSSPCTQKPLLVGLGEGMRCGIESGSPEQASALSPVLSLQRLFPLPEAMLQRSPALCSPPLLPSVLTCFTSCGDTQPTSSDSFLPVLGVARQQGCSFEIRGQSTSFPLKSLFISHDPLKTPSPRHL